MSANSQTETRKYIKKCFGQEQWPLNEGETDDLIKRIYGEVTNASRLLFLLDMSGGEELMRTLAKGGPLVDYLGRVMLVNIISGDIAFFEQIISAAAHKKAGFGTEEKIDLAYRIASLSRKRSLLGKGMAGAVAEEECNPTLAEIVEAYLKEFPNTKQNTAKMQISRWLKKTKTPSRPVKTRRSGILKKVK